jgi:hypothetical protein
VSIILQAFFSEICIPNAYVGLFIFLVHALLAGRLQVGNTYQPGWSNAITLDVFRRVSVPDLNELIAVLTDVPPVVRRLKRQWPEDLPIGM